MKKVKRILSVLLTLCLAACMVSPAFAAEKYTYTVRLLDGEHGKVTGTKEYKFNYDEQQDESKRWNPNVNTFSVEAEDGYYFKGFHSIVLRRGLGICIL